MSSRNKPCRCGSGEKYKRCCLPHDRRMADSKAQLEYDMKHRPHLTRCVDLSLPISPFPPGRLAFVLAGVPRYWVEKPGNYVDAHEHWYTLRKL